jgi:hypothetical protein
MNLRDVLVLGALAASVAASVAACSSGPASSPPQVPAATSAPQGVPATSAPQGNSTPAAAGTETPPPGDIPDTTVYVPFSPTAGKYRVKVPEGWARTVSSGAVSFTDKLNTITVQLVKASSAPTEASARATEIPGLQSSQHSFALTGVTSVTRSAGPALLIKYTADSQPDPVTGKVYTDAVERYEFYRNGTEAIVTLSGPSGADNVDPWRTVTDSLRWLV